MQPWKTLSRETILDYSKFLTVEQHTVELPDGQVIVDWPWVVTPDYVNVVAVTEDGRFLLFRQTKYAVSGTTLATVGGYLEPGEVPLAAAQRELREETGYAAPDWLALGSYVVDGNRGAGTAHFFLARRAYPVTAIDADDLEEQILLHLTPAEVEAALAAGEFKVLAWMAVIALALRYV
ncbi:MAG: NUDIX hydrolase [Ardenticatenaceae bacterium]|nr:NUDIX hydrolase [Ardenticatenaceae bacterium]